MNDKKAAIGLVALIAVIVLLLGSVFIVKETEQVLVLQFGDPVQQITSPGLHFKIPLIQNLKVFDNRILNVDPPSEEVLLSDQKRLVVDTFARYRISDMLKYYQTLGTENAAVQRLYNIITSTMRSELGRAPLPDVLSEKRKELMLSIQNTVNDETSRFGIEIVDVRIVRADLPEEVTQATYDRMRSEREREAREARGEGEELSLQIRSRADKDRTVLLSEAQRDAEIARGQGDEEAISIYAEAFNRDPRFYAFYRSMEAYKKSLANKDKTLVLSPDSDFFRYLENNPAR
ncbi:MAG: HflC protein [Alphaproteobacteria bacterium]|nr:HflC protein [Alphaproteobacteria bacterium]